MPLCVCVQVEVPRPDADGRAQILAIQTRRLRERRCLSKRAAAALGSGALAEVTSGFSGADLAGLMRSATSFALERYVDDALLKGWTPGAAGAAGAAASLGVADEDDDGAAMLEVEYDDIVRALREASPRPAYARRATAGASCAPGGGGCELSANCLRTVCGPPYPRGGAYGGGGGWRAPAPPGNAGAP